MRHDPAEIEAALASLIALPLWSSGRAADVQWFQFGAQRVIHGRLGAPRVVGEFALHVQCAWRLAGPEGIVVASRDRHVPAGDPDAEPPGWRWDVPGANRSDERCAAWFATRAAACVERVTADAFGGLRVALTGGVTLEVFPDDSLDREHWRYFQPATEEPHFVVTGAGVE